MVGADDLGECRRGIVIDVAAGRRVTAHQPDIDAARRGIAQVRQPAVPVAVVEEDGSSRLEIELHHGFRLRPDVAVAPGRFRRLDGTDRVLERGDRLLTGVGCFEGDPLEGQHRRVEQDEPRWSEPGDREGRGRDSAPAVPDDLELSLVESRRADERRDVGGVVAEAVVALPVPRTPMSGLVDGDDASAGRGQRRPDPPPHGSRCGHAVEQQDRPRIRGAVEESRPRQPARFDGPPLAWLRRDEGSNDGVGQTSQGHQPTLARSPVISPAHSAVAWSTAQAVSVLSDDRYRVPLAILALACILGFVSVALLVFGGVTTTVDTTGLDALSRFHGTPLDPAFVAISELGVADILAFFSMITAGFVWAAGARRAAVYIVVGYVAAAVVSDAIKAVLPLARPPVTYQIPLRMSETEDLLWIGLAILLVIVFWRTRWRWGAVIGAALFAIALFWDPTPLSTPGMDSFPSGHALRSIVLVASVLFALPVRISRKATAALVTVVILIGVSRVYLGEHHPSDVVAGWLLGFAMIAALTIVPFFRSPEEARRLEAVRGKPASESPPEPAPARSTVAPTKSRVGSGA
jgi:membrane-associated phospholipid phosphatase